MAASSDKNDHGAEGVWPEFDPFMVDDFDDDDFLDLAGNLQYSLPLVTPMQNVTTGADGGNGCA